MRGRLSAVLTVVVTGVALGATTLAPASGASRHPAPGPTPDGWCTTQPAPCIESASRNGVALSEGGAYDFTAVSTAGTGRQHADSAQWFIDSLPTTDVGVPFSVTVKVGFDPRETDEYADESSCTRSLTAATGT
jgi:hypothetical protein